MSVLQGLRRRLQLVFGARAADRDLDDEIRLHLELETEKNIRAGMRADEAWRLARIAFGGVDVTKEAHRDGRGTRWFEDLASDARFALRVLRRSPALTLAAVITLALGVGANTAIFSAVNAVILRPLPFHQPDRLVMLWESNPEFHWDQQDVAPANMLDWREQVHAFSDVAAYMDGDATGTLTGQGAPRLLSVAGVSGNFFSVLGVHPEVGRALRDAETWKNGARVMVISDRLWREQFAADPGVVGRTIMVNGKEAQVVGVMPRSFRFPSETIDAWMPLALDPASRGDISFRRAHWMRAIARLAPGVSLERANAELQTVVRRLQVQYPETNRVMGAGMTPLHDFLVRDSRRPLVTLLAAVALLLLIACANVGNLLLVRAAGRERETAMRLALGAGRARLVRQALTESVVLSLIGGAAGFAIGWWGTRVLIALQPPGMLPESGVRMDWAVLGYVVAITTLSGMLLGVAPAAWSARRTPAEVLKEGGRSGSDARRMRRWGQALVIGEVAIALLLSVGAGLLVRTFYELTQVNPGFDARGVLTVALGASGPRYDSDEKVQAFYADVLRRVRALPGVTDAAATAELPLTDWGWTSQFSVAGRAPGEYGNEVAHREVTPGYFRTMRVPVIRGRAFTQQDAAKAPRVVLINEALARQFFAGQDPIGQRVTFDKSPDSTSVWRTIVGVVGDERQTSLGTETKIQFMTPFAQETRQEMTLVIRTPGDPSTLAPAVRRIVSAVDPGLAIASVRTMADVRSASLARQRFLMMMLLVFAGVGIALAVVGVYGVMAQYARGRSREMGIRLALGAQRVQVRWLVVRRGMWLVGAGLAAGIGVALAATRFMQAFLFDVTPVDPVTFVAVPLLLLLTAAAATWLPALRASRADPVATLREE
jgi:putative ABC transport system permease protein